MVSVPFANVSQTSQTGKTVMRNPSLEAVTSPAKCLGYPDHFRYFGDGLEIDFGYHQLQFWFTHESSPCMLKRASETPPAGPLFKERP